MSLPKLTMIDPVVVHRMVTMLPRQTAEDIQDCFGISLNTWTKLRRGEAIRHSVATRLIARLENAEPNAAAA